MTNEKEELPSGELKKTEAVQVCETYEADSVEPQNANEPEEGVLYNDRTRLKQGLKERHIKMLTLVGVFGTGLFLSSGGTLKKAGPAGMFLAYVVVGIVVGCNQIAIAEVASFMPATGATIRHAEQFIDESVGFTFGWISTYSSLMPGELSATAVVMRYWTDINPAVWITIFGILFVLTNIYTIRFYGEVEYFFGWMKIILIIILIVTGLVIDLGGAKQERLGFHYWREPGPFAEYIVKGEIGKFVGFWAALSSVVYSYSGIQNIAILAGETKNSRHAIFHGARNVFLRIIVLYLIAVLVLTLIVPYNDKLIATGTGTAKSSPYVIAIQRANIKILPHIINAIILTSAWSAGNLAIVEGSRNLFALASKNQAPKIFLTTNKRGIPYVGIAFISAFLPLSYMSVSSSSANVFSWFQELVSSNTLLRWILISANHIHMDRALKAQGYSRSDLPHSTCLGPFAAWFSGIMSLIFLLTGGFYNFIHGHFDIESFFTRYFIIPLAIILFTFWKLFKKTKYLRPAEVDLESIFEDIRQNPEITLATTT
ncbi:KLTH0A00308p [Lachancea thermotolerans CBS 6340]|uniref:KLTH0A00308p n=1 Tax=Lachancea thermotolerans (strain ATCC 56472 / CBS 6340 / NRRL Y-8284) TaxID=559295 RepID=C5DB79_LACTC|nr:KLTH0A00308p [Lachancea thermotolerans CBS 6340]CAR21036.1 KLTH0A00308p [Lachancea thermotolerans CBS 6340]